MADSKLYSTIEATVKDYVASYVDAVQKKDAAILSRALDANCQRELNPGSMFRSGKIPFDPNMNNAAYEKHMANELATLEYTKAEILDMSIDTVAIKAAARSAHRLKLIGGAEHIVEFCWFLDLTEDGSRIKKIMQFVDFVGGSGFLAEMKEITSKEVKSD